MEGSGLDRIPNDEALKAKDALLRASRLARKLAAQTQTRLIVQRAGKLVKEHVPLAELDECQDPSR